MEVTLDFRFKLSQKPFAYWYSNLLTPQKRHLTVKNTNQSTQVLSQAAHKVNSKDHLSTPLFHQRLPRQIRCKIQSNRIPSASEKNAHFVRSSNACVI